MRAFLNRYPSMSRILLEDVDAARVARGSA